MFTKTARSFVAACSLAAAAGLLTVLPAYAGSTLPMTQEQTLARADAVFIGTITQATPRRVGAGGGMIVTDFTISIERVVVDDGLLAARTRGANTTLTFAGGQIGEEQIDVSVVPTMNVGERAFFFISREDINAMCPLVGNHHGLYRIEQNGEAAVPRVMHQDVCCGMSGPVKTPYFAKMSIAGEGFTPDQFAAEIARAFPVAKQQPQLRASPNTGVPEQWVGKALSGAGIGLSTITAGVPAGGGQAQVAPAPLPGTPEAPAPVARVLSAPAPDDQTTLHTVSAYEARYGFNRNGPDLPIVYNITTAMYPTFGINFEYSQSAWNQYGSDVFRRYTNQDNSMGWPNSRNETGFVSQSEMQRVWAYTWGANTLAVNISRSVNNKIIETDIMYNPVWSWTTNAEAAYADQNLVYFNQTALHELGHSFGRSHSWISNPAYGFPSVMNYWSQPFYLTEANRVFADDSASIRVMYPSRAVNITDSLVTMWCMNGTQSPTDSTNEVRDLTFSQASVQAGSSFTASNMWVENVGTNTQSVTFDFYLCPTARSFSGARYCNSSFIATLNSFTGGAVNRTVTVPANCPAGSYTLAAVIAASDGNGANSQAWSLQRITVTPPPPPPPPNNNSVSNCTGIVAGTYFGTTANATVDGSTTCGSSNSTPDVWFCINAPYAGTLVADSCGSAFDTVLSIHQQALILPNTTVYQSQACDDDGAACGGNKSDVRLAVSAGNTYFIRVSGYDGARGNYQLNVRILPRNDECFAAAPALVGQNYASNVNATASGGAFDCLNPISKDVWFQYTSGCSGLLAFDTYASNFDTVMAIYDGCGGTQLDCNDDSNGGLGSFIAINAAAGATYWIRIGGYVRPFDNLIYTGNIALNIAPLAPANDTCLSPLDVSDSSYAIDTTCAATDAPTLGGACGLGDVNAINDLWFRYTAPCSGQASISFCDVDFDLVASQFSIGDTCPIFPGEENACALVSDACSGAASLTFDVVSGGAYMIRVGGFAGGALAVTSGHATMTIACVEGAPMNDACETAAEIANSPATVALIGNLFGAANDGSSAGVPDYNGADVWYRWTAPCDGALAVSTCGTFVLSNMNTSISVHTACPGDPSNELAYGTASAATYCPTDYLDDDAETVLGVTAGSTYYIRVAAQTLETPVGPFSLTLAFYVNFDSASYPQEVTDGTTLFCTNGATPSDFGSVTFPDLWFHYVPTCTGTASLDLCGIPYDTQMAVYLDEGFAPPTNELAFNEDNGPLCEGVAASISMHLSQGVPVYIRVGSGADVGLALTISCASDAPPCPADFNQDGGIDGADVQDFFTAWEAGDAAGDVNFDGGVDGADVETFFAAWEAGGC